MIIYKDNYLTLIRYIVVRFTRKVNKLKVRSHLYKSECKENRVYKLHILFLKKFYETFFKHAIIEIYSVDFEISS